jgi:hypothetical protein
VAALALGALILIKSLGGAIPLTDSGVQRIAQAIAFAEGFYVNGSRPQRNHNPGDMTQDLIGRKIGMDGAFVIYSSDDDGWSNLYKQVEMWLGGSSSHASASSTISDLSSFYTTTDQAAWATNVANQLGVSIDTPIGDIS